MDFVINNTGFHHIPPLLYKPPDSCYTCNVNYKPLLCYNDNNRLETCYCLLHKIMGRMKELLLQKQEEEQELWISYLEFCNENKELFSQLPKNIQDLLLEDYE